MPNRPTEALAWALRELEGYMRIKNPKQHLHLLLDLDALGINLGASILRNRIEIGQKSLREALLEDRSAMLVNAERSRNWQRIRCRGIGFSTKNVQDFFHDPLQSTLPKEIPDNDPKWFEKAKRFIQKEPDSILHPHLAQELAELRRRNTDESLRQLKELLDAYVVRDSKVKSEKRKKEIEKWFFEILPALNEEEAKIEKEENNEAKNDKWARKLKPEYQREEARERISERYKVSAELIAINLPILTKIKRIIEILRYYLQRQIASQYISNDSVIPLLLGATFCTHPHLQEIVPDVFEICRELAIYKKIRQELTGQRYLPGHFILKLASVWKDDYETYTPDFDYYRDWTPPKSRKIYKAASSSFPPKIYHQREKPPEFYVYPESHSKLREVLAKISQQFGLSSLTLKKIYGEYRRLEAKINLEEEYWPWKNVAKDRRIRKIFRDLDNPALTEPLSGLEYFAILFNDGFYELQ